jgi:hypothetical protein
MKGVGERESSNLTSLVLLKHGGHFYNALSYRSVCRNLSDHIIFQLQRNGAERRENFRHVGK